MSRLKLVDIVNLNANASCLSSERWTKALEGGTNSELYQILKTYVDLDQKVTLGIIGNTLIDIKKFNPETISLIAGHPQNFEIIYRPLVHSLSIFWSDTVFRKNVSLGKQVIESMFKNTIKAYLPPEFVLRNSQLITLKKLGIHSTFIHSKRLKTDLIKKIPTRPFTIQTIQNQTINCIPFWKNFDSYYLSTIQRLDKAKSYPTDDLEVIFGWRDGESPFFLPECVEREQFFIKESSEKFERVFLSEVQYQSQIEKNVSSYPQNSLLPWLGNFRLLWYINEVKLLESEFSEMSEIKKILFMLLLNSDVLSSTEKNDIKITLGDFNNSEKSSDFMIRRQSRNLEAEEIIYLIENNNDKEIMDYLKSNPNSFTNRILAKIEFISQLTN